MRKTLFPLVFFLTFAALVGLPAEAQGTYTQIDYPGAAQTFVEGINTAGDIIGIFGNQQGTELHGFLLSGGVYTVIDYPGATYTSLWGLNDKGQIVGSTGTSVVSFLYDIATQTFTTISYPNAADTFAFAINNSGTIAGYFYDATRNSEYGFELAGSRYRVIVPPGVHKKDSSVCCVSASGKLIGSVTTKRHGLHGNVFEFQHGRYTPIKLPNALGVWVGGIDPEGTAIVGGYTTPSGVFAGYLYRGTIFLTLQFPGSTATSAQGINALGEVVGTFYDAVSAPHGFLWTPPADAAFSRSTVQLPSRRPLEE